MKKIYLIALMLVAGMVMQASVVGERIALPVKDRSARAAAKAPARAVEWPEGEYKSLGTGTMTDDMVAPLYSYQPVTYAVEIEQNVDNPDFYRILTPYGQAFADAMLDVNGVTLRDGQYDKDGKCAIDICVSDPDDVYFAVTPTGCDWGSGEMSIGINSRYNVTFKDGVISAPILAIAVVDDDGAYAMNRNGRFRIVLPGAESADYTLSLDVSSCFTDRTVHGVLSRGADVATVRYTVIPDFQEDEILGVLADVAEAGGIFDIVGGFTYPMDEVRKETLVVVGLNAAGERVGYDWKTYYYVDQSNDGWEDCGTVTFRDGMLQTFYNIEPQEVTASLQRNSERPRYLRIVNPYGGHTHFPQYSAGHGDHNHYIYINAEDDECIYLEESPVCLNFGHGVVRVSSFVHYFIGAGYDIEECKELELGATLEDGVLRFPEESLIISMLGYDNRDWYSVDPASDTYVVMPEGFSFDDSGVEDIVAGAPADEAPVYYNLQGQRIENPASGTLVIERRGNTVAKRLVR